MFHMLLSRQFIHRFLGIIEPVDIVVIPIELFIAERAPAILSKLFNQNLVAVLTVKVYRVVVVFRSFELKQVSHLVDHSEGDVVVWL